jgi:hypothetical protein
LSDNLPEQLSSDSWQDGVAIDLRRDVRLLLRDSLLPIQEPCYKGSSHPIRANTELIRQVACIEFELVGWQRLVKVR